MTEAQRYQEAVARAIANPDDNEPIVTMMELAIEGRHPTIRRWAGTWLLRTHAVVVTEDKEPCDAASTEATHIR